MENIVYKLNISLDMFRYKNKATEWYNKSAEVIMGNYDENTEKGMRMLGNIYKCMTKKTSNSRLNYLIDNPDIEKNMTNCELKAVYEEIIKELEKYG